MKLLGKGEWFTHCFRETENLRWIRVEPYEFKRGCWFKRPAKFMVIPKA